MGSGSDKTDRRRYRLRRRTLLAGTGSALFLTGCVGDDDDSEERQSVQALGWESDDDDDDDDAEDAEIDVEDDIDFPGERLTVLVWGGIYGDRFRRIVQPLYENTTGGILNVVEGDENIDEQIASGEVDVAVTDGYFYNLVREQETIVRPRLRNIPHREDLVDALADRRSMNWGFPVDAVPCTVVHRELFGIDTWEDFVDTGTPARITLDATDWALTLHAVAVGLNPSTGASELYGDDFEAVFERIAELDVVSWTAGGDEIWNLFNAGEIDVAQHYFDQVHYTIDLESPDLHYTVPERSPTRLNHWVIAEGTDNQRMAEHLLNFLLNPDLQTRWAETSPAIYSNEKTTYPGGMGDILPTTSEEIETLLFPDWEAFTPNRDALFDRVEDVRGGAPP